MPGFKTVQEAAAELGVCRAAIYPLYWRGQLDTVKVGSRRFVSEESIARAKAAQPRKARRAAAQVA